MYFYANCLTKFPGSSFSSGRICWFHLPYVIVNLIHLGFRLLVWQNKQSDDITLGFEKLGWAFFFVWHFLEQMIIKNNNGCLRLHPPLQ